MKSLVLLAIAFLASSATHAARPLALVGLEEEVQTMQSDITNKERIRTVAFDKSLPDDFGAYAAVVFCGPAPRGVDEKKVPAGVRVLRCEAPTALRLKYLRARRPLAEADDKGESVLTPEGREVRDMTERNRKAVLALPELDRTLPPVEWDTKPLGPPGHMTYSTELRHKPEFRAPPVRRPGLVLLDGARQAVIAADLGNRRLRKLANELKYHLDKIGGRQFKVVQKADPSADAPVVELREVGGEPGRSVIFREGDRLVLGGESCGVSHSLTYFLEALGCRYLWPGADGKVIPRMDRIVCPELALDFVPQLKVREIREYPKLEVRGFAAVGIDTNAFVAAYHAKLIDAPGNRGFFEWHGLNDGRNTKGAYLWGHYFGNYWDRFGETHLDWFAMQANGSRKQTLGDRPERPTLCLSSIGLAEQAARDVVADFRKNPSMAAHSICLPDGGYMGQCMCEGCRRLDPVNAPPVANHTCSPLWRTFPYVSMTDRVMTFNNRVAELVTAQLPGKKLSAYIYSYYKMPPVAVKPHPALVLLTADGSYTRRNRRAARDSVAAWSVFGNELFWRPNALRGWHANVPQNLGRPLFEDLEALKCNNVIGSDHDCFTKQWANRGFETYMLSKAHLNPDHLDYDTIAGDYFEKGFGPAAKEIAAYFAALEKLCDESAAADRTADQYLAAFDVDALAGFLSRARKAAAGDDAVVRRVDFLMRGIEYARIEKRLAAAAAKPDKTEFKALQREYVQFLRDHAAEDSVAVNPYHIVHPYWTPHIRGAY